MAPKIILLIGKNGQLARSFIEYSQLLNKNKYVLCAIGRDTLDLETSSEDAYCKVFNIFKPDLIINAAAFTNVDDAEIKLKTANQVNALSLEIISKECKSRNIPLIHFSTDYVFDGSGSDHWKVDAITNPINIYGKSKLTGENIIKKSGIKFIIFRISWVFGHGGNNFVESMLNVANKKDLRIVKDQFGGPTSAKSVAISVIQSIPDIISNNAPNNILKKTFPWGIYHLQGTPVVSRFDFAKEIFLVAYNQKIIKKIPNLIPIFSSDYNTPANRPLNSRLDCQSTIKDLKIKLPLWKEDLKEYLLKL